MCPDEDKPSFEDIAKHKFFNTNNLWIHLPQLKATLEQQGGVLKLPLIKNKKTVNPRDKATPKVGQKLHARWNGGACLWSLAQQCAWAVDPPAEYSVGNLAGRWREGGGQVTCLAEVGVAS